jgi:HEAT repeat protein
MRSTLCGLLMVFAGATMALAQLQQQPPSEPDDGLDALRTKDPLSDEDRGTLRAWIGERIAAVVGEDATGAQQAVAQLRRANRGGRGFLDAFGAVAVESIGSAYKKADLAPATRMITIVGELNDPRALDTLLEALKDERPAIRAAAAVGLRKLQPKIVTDPDAIKRTLAGLREAGEKETSPRTLDLIYRAMNLADAPSLADRRASSAAIAGLLDERLKRGAKERMQAEGGDLAALQALDPQRGNLDEDARRQYINVLGRLLYYNVRRYVADEPLSRVRDRSGSPEIIELRNHVEVTIREAEKQLTALVGAPEGANVTQDMEKARVTEMAIAMNKWSEKLKSSGLDLPDVQRAPGEEPEPDQP